MVRRYVYIGDRQTDLSFKNLECEAVLNDKGKCVRGKNGNMLVSFKGREVVVMARLLRKLK